MSFQAQPQQQQQPVQVYPTTVTNQPPSHHYSNGSFGAVFIVLAVIIVISALACFLGRLCNRRHHPQGSGPSPSPAHVQKPVKQHNPNQFRPKEGGDIELGLDKRIPTLKPNGLGHGYGHAHGPGLGYGGVGGSRGPRPPTNGGSGSDGHGGDMKGFEMKLGHEGFQRA